MFAVSILAMVLIPLILWGFAQPPAGESGAAIAGSTCGTGTCHSHGATITNGDVTAVLPSTYTPGGAAIPITVNLAGASTFSFEMSAVSGSTQAGSFTAGTGSMVSTLAGIQYILSTGRNPSFAFSWTPPATNVGTVTLNLAGSTGTSNIHANTYTMTAASMTPPPLPTLNLSASTTTGLSFTGTVGGTAPAAQTVMVTTSDASAVTFNETPTSTGNWLTVGGSTGTGTGTTPASESIGVVLTGLAAGTYSGHVTYTSSAVSNSPVTLPVTLTVNSSTPPPPTGTETFSLIVVDRQSTTTGGGDWLLLDGNGDTSKTPIGGGNFTRFRSMSRESERGGSISATTAIAANGTWQATSVTSSAAGKLVLGVQLTTKTSSSSTMSNGTLTITDNGSCSGATLAITGGATFNSVGIGGAKLGNPGTASCGTTGGGGTPPPPDE